MAEEKHLDLLRLITKISSEHSQNSDQYPIWGTRNGWKNVASQIQKLIDESNRLVGKKDHPEDYCHRCGGRNMEWHTDNKTWNEIVREGHSPEEEDWRASEIICPPCLDELDREKRKGGSHWHITNKDTP